MSERPLVSAIIAVKNGATLLGEAIESVLGQSYDPLETIVVDGGSTDGSTEIARSYDGVTWLPQAGDGLAGAWNQAIEACRGELIAFLDSDDIWQPGKLHAQVELLGERPELAGTDGLARFTLVEGAEAPPGFRLELLEGEHPAHMPGTLLVRRSLFESVGLFDSQYVVALDVDWLARVKDAGHPIETIPRLLLEKRFHPGNLSHSMPERYRAEMIRLVRSSAARQAAAAG